MNSPETMKGNYEEGRKADSEAAELDPDFKAMVSGAIGRLKTAADKGIAALQAEWAGIGGKEDQQANAIRTAIQSKDKGKWWPALKAQAAAVKEAASA